MEVREPSAKYLARAAFKQTEAGVIPEDWVIICLGDLTDPKRPISYGVVQTGPYVVGGIQCLRVVDIDNGRVKNSDFITTSKEISDRYKRTLLQGGDIVMPLRGKVGDAALICEELAGSNITRGVAVIAVQASICPAYCKHVIAFAPTRQRLFQAMNGSALQEISIAQLRVFSIPLPITYIEQQAIATALSDADALIESLEQVLAKKRQIKQGAMQELLTAQRRLPGFSGEWEETTLGNAVVRFVGGGTPSRQNNDYWNGTVPWMTVKDFVTHHSYGTQESITEFGLRASASNLIPAGTLITSTRMAIGKAVLFDVDVAINQDLKALFFSSRVLAKYMFYWFQFKETELSFIGSGSTVTGISLPELRKIPAHIPSHTEQTAIAQVLSDMDADIAAVETRLTKARAIKQGMMQELLTGRIRLV